ncbi:hypothetical protein HMPREF0080_00542 [Anaeroglobus geminatus F0357]|uniref:Uncharacterized protein n=1 Tax=Anaeroglobus geminatus F0357 TaxID=861450 RepID=G9YFY0_9FIRM|nr:hypothetical protein HMPREF0080_00542 [Anaeroglobus geminatus F0357]
MINSFRVGQMTFLISVLTPCRGICLTLFSSYSFVPLFVLLKVTYILSHFKNNF